MDILRVDYSKLSNIETAAEGVAKRFERRIDDYEGVIKNLNKVSSGKNRGYISSAISSIKRKQSSLEEKANALRSFGRRCEEYVDKAKQTDKTVANRISRETEQFKKVNNIKISFFDNIKAAIELWIRNYFGRAGSFGRGIYAALTEKMRDIKYEIREWYHDGGGKYLLECAKDIGVAVLGLAAFIGAVFVTGGVGALLASVFAMYKGTMALAYDAAAYSVYQNGSGKARADRLGEKGGRDVFVESAVNAAEAMGADAEYAHKTANIIYTIAEVSNFVYGAYKGIAGIKKSWQSFKEASGGSFNIMDFKKNLKTFNDMEKMNKFYSAVNTNDKATMKLVPKTILSMNDGSNKLTLIQLNTINSFRKNVLSVIDFTKLTDVYNDSRRMSFNYRNSAVGVSGLGSINYTPLTGGSGGGGMGGRGGTSWKGISVSGAIDSYRRSVAGGAAA